MTDQPQADTSNDLVVRDVHGNPLPLGTRMIEKESYERVIEGLKIAAEGAAHCAVHEYRVRALRAVNAYSGLARRLDQVRLMCVDVAGLRLKMRERETEAVHGEPMSYRNSRRRLRDGIKQAAGGMRQLATCHRGDLRWSVMASSLEMMLRKLIAGPSRIATPGRGLILPSAGMLQ